MTKRFLKAMPLLAAVFLAAGCGGEAARAQPGGIEVTQAWSRAVPVGAPVAGGFMTLRNTGAGDDRLVEVRSGAARHVEIHEMRHEDGIARMRRMDGGLPLPAGATVELKPGGYHLMFISPEPGAFEAGRKVAATLVLERGGELAVEFEVRAAGAAAHDARHAHGDHGH